MKKSILLILSAACMLAQSCTDVKNEPITPGDAIPKQVSDITWVATPGGAEISYTLPNDPSLLYVEAVYTLKSGEIRNAKASFYQNKLEIEGLADVAPCKVELYSVGRNAKRSEPKKLEITPLEAPVWTTFYSVSMEPTFGGVRVQFTNETEASLAVTVLTTDDAGELYATETFYSESAKGDYAARGFDTVERTFGVCVRDQWQNKSDTLFVSLTPKFEMELDKKKWKRVDLPGSTHDGHVSTKLEGMWDGLAGNATASFFHTKPNTGFPQWFNFDMGVEATLSRHVLHHRTLSGSDGVYTAGAVKKWSIWGSTDPDPDGGWNNWILLGTFNSIKPSGLPGSEKTDEDYQYAAVIGESFDFPMGLPPVRYIRFVTEAPWGNVTYMYASELTLFGDDGSHTPEVPSEGEGEGEGAGEGEENSNN